MKARNVGRRGDGKRSRAGRRKFATALPLPLMLLAGCFPAAVAGMGGFTVIDSAAMSKVQQIGDAELAADAQRLEGKSLQAGTGEYYAALCLQGYIEGRYAEAARNNTSDATEQSTLQGQVASGFGRCANDCKVASEQLTSSYSVVAARYQPRCAEGMASQQAEWSMQSLVSSVDQFKEAEQPLELFFADRDSRQALEQMRAEHPDEPRLVDYAAAIEALSETHAAAIAKGKAFFEGPEAQKNFAARRSLEAEMKVLESEIQGIERTQDDWRRIGSLDAHMRVRELDDQKAAKRRVLAAKADEVAALKAEYYQLAADRGVYKAVR